MSLYKEERSKALEDIKTRPENHKHTYRELINCCKLGGVIDVILMEAHVGLAGKNNGLSCDVVEGPCGCGAWH